MTIELRRPRKDLIIAFGLANEPESPIVGVDSLLVTLFLASQSITLKGQLVTHQPLL
jgi:hypothetical protein